VNGYKSIPATRVIHDFYRIDSEQGFYGGGGIDARSATEGMPLASAYYGGPPDEPGWGSAFKANLKEYFTHTAAFVGHTTSLPQPTNSVSLDPELKDKWGRPALRTTYMDHADDLKTMEFIHERAMELLDAAGAKKTWGDFPAEGQRGSVHLLGTCRMGDDPKNSVVDRYNRAHDVPNLFICDGSSLVTSGRGQPTMTIMALAFRAAEHIIEAARRGEV
jgi:choline dehydrogenase-like flavoprotein